MPHFGVLAFKGLGHLNPLFALSRCLVSRGHRVTFFLPPHMEQTVLLQGLQFSPLLLKTPPRAPTPAPRNTLQWIRDTNRKIRRIGKELEDYIHAYPIAIQGHNVDALLMGEITLTGPTVAELMHLPYFVISTSIPHNFGWPAPNHLQPALPWQQRMQQRLLQVSIFRMRGPVAHSLRSQRKQRGLPSQPAPALAHITQWPQCLTPSLSRLSALVHFTGPFAHVSAPGSAIPFPWHKLDSRPLVYASLGTTKRGDPALFRHIAQACHSLRLQLVITLGGRPATILPGPLPGNPIVVERAPQQALLQRCHLVITHAGPNTVLEALLQAKPMLAMPLSLDQPAIATRLQELGCAIVLGPRDRSVSDILQALHALHTSPRHRLVAQDIRDQLQPLQGTTLAAGVIESRLSTYAHNQ